MILRRADRTYVRFIIGSKSSEFLKKTLLVSMQALTGGQSQARPVHGCTVSAGAL